jgi:hypothetical protein
VKTKNLAGKNMDDDVFRTFKNETKYRHLNTKPGMRILKYGRRARHETRGEEMTLFLRDEYTQLQNIYKFDLCGVCGMYLLSSHTIFHTIHNKFLFLCVGIYKRNNINRTSSFCHHLLDIKLVQFIAKQKVKEASN